MNKDIISINSIISFIGCDLNTSFTVENADRRLPTLAPGARREISLWFVFWPYWTCTLDIRSSWYLGCRGSKIFLRQYYNAAVRLFTISRKNSNAPYFLRVSVHFQITWLITFRLFQEL